LIGQDNYNKFLTPLKQTILNLYSILGKFCCLFCHIQKDQLKIPVDVRGRLEKRTLSTLDKDLDHMTHTYNGDTKKAKLCNNVIGKRVFNVPIDQV